jgi:hypothetical protein
MARELQQQSAQKQAEMLVKSRELARSLQQNVAQVVEDAAKTRK